MEQNMKKGWNNERNLNKNSKARSIGGKSAKRQNNGWGAEETSQGAFVFIHVYAPGEINTKNLIRKETIGCGEAFERFFLVEG